MDRGKLIVIEGPDGSGKTTTCKNISQKLTDNDIQNEVVSLPNRSYFGYLKIRELLKTYTNTDILQSLMIVNMQDVFQNYIFPKIESGTTIILDRWLVSTIIYNEFNNGKLIESMAKENQDGKKILNIKYISDFIINLPIYPDQIFYLSIPKSIILKHARNRNGIELNDKESNVRNIYNLYNEFCTSLKTGSAFPFNSKKYRIEDDDADKHFIIKPEITDDNDYSEKLMYDNAENAIISKLYTLFNEKIKESS